jgi:hypothetical protein
MSTLPEGRKPSKPARLSRLDVDGWELDSGVARKKEAWKTFWIPIARKRSRIVAGDFVKLIFQVRVQDEAGRETVFGERMWVKAEGTDGPYFWGTLANDPSFDGQSIGLAFGAEIAFLPEHVINVMSADEQRKQEQAFLARAQKRLN